MKLRSAIGLAQILLLASTAIAMGGKPKMPEKLYATLETSQGKIVCLLYANETPITVANFVGLAQGTKTGKPFYDGTIFHRVIPDFMIQGGDPQGTGMGGPGYQFKDEIVDGLSFDRPGRLAMANAGPGTNGSQFFITVAPTLWLTGKHTIFGQVVEGQDIVEKISLVRTGPNDKPLEPVVINKVVITEEI